MIGLADRTVASVCDDPYHILFCAVESQVVAGNIEQLHQDVYRLETMARKEVPSRRQDAHM